MTRKKVRISGARIGRCNTPSTAAKRLREGRPPRPAADESAGTAPLRRGEELHQRIDREEQRYLLRRGCETQCVKRQKRDDEAEPDKIDKNDEEQGRHVCRPDIATRGGAARVSPP